MSEVNFEGQPKYKKNEDGSIELTVAGEEALRPWVTDLKGDVYAITPEGDQQIVAAAMARLSRNPNDLRAIMASEFLDDQMRNEDLLRRVVNKFGDDSVMQLYPMQMVFEDVSNIGTKELEWGRLGAYLEQSTRYLRFDQKDSEGHYRYYTPEELDDDTKQIYEQSMDGIFDIYSELYEIMLEHIKQNSSVPEAERDGAWRTACHAKACDTIRAILPSATKATVGMAGSAQAFYNMIIRMNGHELPEIRKLGSKALVQARLVSPVFFERTDMPTRGGLITNHQKETRESVKELARQLMGAEQRESQSISPVRLISVDGNEEQLAAKILADASQYPYEDTLKMVQSASYDQIAEIIETYAGERFNRRAKPGRAFELIHYFFEVECDYGAFRDIQRHRMVDGFEWQELHPNLGHVTNDAIKDAGIEQKYEQAFAISESLYNTLRERGYNSQAQYATLFGHIMRFSMKVNARALLQSAELRTTPQGHPSYRKVYQDMHTEVARVHPIIADAMKFVSQSEDEELARLGAERYNQSKH